MIEDDPGEAPEHKPLDLIPTDDPHVLLGELRQGLRDVERRVTALERKMAVFRAAVGAHRETSSGAAESLRDHLRAIASAVDKSRRETASLKPTVLRARIVMAVGASIFAGFIFLLGTFSDQAAALIGRVYHAVINSQKDASE